MASELTNKPDGDGHKQPSAAREVDLPHDGSEVRRAAQKLSEGAPEGMERVQEFMAMSMNMGNPVNPIHQKMTEGHITKVLDLAVQHDERQYQINLKHIEIQASNRWFELAVFLVCVAVVLVIVIMFKSNTDFITKFFGAIFAYGAGFGSAWGWSARGKKSKSNSN